jgi:hypothetical protein
MTDLQRIREGEATKYNSSFDILSRINALWVDANNFRRMKGGVGLWVETLYALESELSPFLNKEEEKRVEEARVPPVPNDPRSWVIARTRAEAFEKVLRELFHKKGMGLKAGDNLDSVMLGGA